MSRKDDMIKYQGFYDGDIDTIYADFKTRRISAEARDNEREIEKRKFAARNHIRFLVDKFANYLPTHFDFKVLLKNSEKVLEEAEKDIKNWLEGLYHGGDKTFWECLPGIYKTDLIYGTEYTKLFVKDGKVHSKKMYSEDVTIIVNPENVFEILKIIFEWEKEIEDESGGSTIVIMKEVITDKEYQTWQGDVLLETQKHRFGRIPIIILKYEEIDGSEYGESFIKKLMEPQQNINFASTVRDWANYKNSYGLYCVRDVADGQKITGEVKIVPGGLSKIPFDFVGGSLDLTSIENQLDDYVEEIHNLASIPRRKRLDALSGVTATEINLIMRDMNESAKRFVSQCKKAFEEMLELYYYGQHGVEVDVTINYQEMSIEDNEWKQWVATWLSQNGFLNEALKTVGYEEGEIEKMNKEKAEADAKDQANYELNFQKNINRNEEPEQDGRGADRSN